MTALPTLTDVLTKIRPDWHQKVVEKVRFKLYLADITNVDQLYQSLLEGRLNSSLGRIGEKQFSTATLVRLRAELQHYQREVLKRESIEALIHKAGRYAPQKVSGAASYTGVGGVKANASTASSSAHLTREQQCKSMLSGVSSGLRENKAQAFVLAVPEEGSSSEHFFPKIGMQLLNSRSEPILGGDRASSSCSGSRVSSSWSRAAPLSKPASRQSQSVRNVLSKYPRGVLDMLPENGGMRRDDDSLDDLLREAGDFITLAKRGKVKVEPRAHPQLDHLSVGGMSSVREHSGRESPSLASEEWNARSTQSIGAELVADLLQNGSVVSSCRANTVVPESAESSRVQNERWQPVWKRGKRKQMIGVYGK